jgi:hypothetical protein
MKDHARGQSAKSKDVANRNKSSGNILEGLVPLS